MSKTLCGYDFMQMRSLIDSLCRMGLIEGRIRLKKSHSKFKKSHSTNIKSNANIEKISLHKRVVAFDLLNYECDK